MGQRGWGCAPERGSQSPCWLQAQGTQATKGPPKGTSRLKPGAQDWQNCPLYPGGHAHSSTQPACTPGPGRADVSRTSLSTSLPARGESSVRPGWHSPSPVSPSCIEILQTPMGDPKTSLWVPLAPVSVPFCCLQPSPVPTGHPRSHPPGSALTRRRRALRLESRRWKLKANSEGSVPSSASCSLLERSVGGRTARGTASHRRTAQLPH